MVNVSNCNTQASKLEEAATNIQSIISLYEEASSELKNNHSSQINPIKTEINTKITILKNIKSDLIKSANTIRTKAQEIYNKQKAEEETKKNK